MLAADPFVLGSARLRGVKLAYRWGQQNQVSLWRGRVQRNLEGQLLTFDPEEQAQTPTPR